MSRHILSLRVLGFAFALAVSVSTQAAPETPPVPAGDLGRMQGSWTVLAGPKKDIPVTLSVKGEEASVDLVTPLGIRFHAEGKLKLNETVSPRTIDWTGFSLADGQDFPEVLGIYEIRGDTLRMVNGGPNDKRPTQFKKGDGVLADVLTFSRAKTVTSR